MDTSNSTSSSTQLLRIKGVVSLTQLSRSYVYALSAEGKFPSSIPLVPGGNSRAWIASEVEAWIQERIAERNSGVAHV